MKEVLAWGNIDKELKRLRISPKKAWSNGDISVYQLAKEEYEIMSNDDMWPDNGLAWYYSEGSNLPAPNYETIINGHKIIAWPNDIGCNLCADCEEWKGCYPDEEIYNEYCKNETPPEYDNLIAYIDEAIGLCSSSSLAHLTVDLACHNNMTLAELFEKYMWGQTL